MSGDPRDEGRKEGTDFIRAIVAKHREDGTYGGRVETRFPPEPNGYLHVGHTRSIVLNFGLAQENGGVCHLSFDDTNPLTEDMKFVRAIQDDIRWLGYDWGEHLYFASDYFEKLYEFALVLIRKGKAYVDSQTEEEIRENRGTVTEAGRDSAYRGRTVEENLDLFERMKAGEFGDGEHVLRAKIDMAHPNMIMRDPVLYRIRHASHYRRDDEWCIYPLYDYTHGLSDAVEDVTHSLCTLEFENNREIYDWLLDEVGFEEPRTHQYEFGRMNLEYTIVSKRKLLRLVNEGHVDGWDDPRMPTIAGMRKRGIPPEAVVRFTESVGVAKVNNRVDLAKLEFTIRDELNMTVSRVMGVVDPLKVVITNYPEGEGEELDIPSYPRDVPLEGSRPVPFTRELFIERSDFEEDPPKGFRRLSPGVEVRLRYAYFIRCDEVVKDSATGEITELRCTYDPDTKGGNAPDGRKVKGTIHWVSATKGIPAEVRLYDRLFTEPDPEAHEGRDFTEFINPDSLVIAENAYVEPGVAADPAGTRYQFERTGYFMSVEASEGGPGEGSGSKLAFNRIVTLRDTWGKRAVLESTKLELSPQPLNVGVGVSGEEDVSAEPSGPSVGSLGGAGVPSRETAERSVGETSDAFSSRRDRKNPAQEARGEARDADAELAARFTRYQDELGLTEADADILSGSQAMATFFEGALAAEEGLDVGLVANWVVNEVVGALKGRELAEVPLEPGHLGALVALVDQGTISQPVAKDLLQELLEKGGDPRSLVRERGLEKVGDVSELKPLVDKVLSDFPDKVDGYRNGKTGLLGFFMGAIMKETRSKADPSVVRDLLLKALDQESP